MHPIKVGITGQSGFIGSHLYNTIGLYPEEIFTRVPFEDSFFQDTPLLLEFVRSCDVIVHLAAMNRHGDQQLIYDTNIRLVTEIISACEHSGSKPHVLFSSSIQEERDNLYGKSKRDGRQLFEQWAKRNSARFSGFVIPNVFGPFGNPYYNSVVATFCHQLTHGETPRIEVDNELRLIYVGALVRQFIETIKKAESHNKAQGFTHRITISYTLNAKVSDILRSLMDFKEKYLNNGEVPALDTEGLRDLFTTFVSYIDPESFFPFGLTLNKDNRGSFVEIVRLNSGGQVSFSTTKPGVTRGNHFHTRKFERFAAIQGQAKIELRRVGTRKVLSFEMDGKNPSFVDIPIWYTHNITNTGKRDLLTVFWINEQFDPNDPDTYLEEV